MLATRELGPPQNGAKRANELPLRVGSSIVLGALALATTWIGGMLFLLFWLATATRVFWEWARITSWRPLWLVAGTFYAAIFFASLWFLRRDPAFGFTVLVWIFAMVWAVDIAAYFAGRRVGGPKLWPAVSPNKTWSGAIGGTIGGLIAGSIVIMVSGLMLRPMHAAIMLVLIIVAQLGDLMESAVKRRFGVKDSGHLIPGHGGLMDRCDSLIAAAPAALLIGAASGGIDAPAEGLLLW